MKYRICKALLAFILVFSILLPITPRMVTSTAIDAATPVSNETAAVPFEGISTSTNVLPSDKKVTAAELTKDSQILKYIDETVFAAKEHVARLPELETLSSYAFLNSDGTTTVYYMDKEVKYIDSDGIIVEKDISLTSTSKGYSTLSNDVVLELPNNPASGIVLSYNGYDISLIPQGGSLQKIAKSSGNTVTYPDYFGTDMSLVYTPTLSGLKEEIVLSRYTGINTFTFQLNTDGLNLYFDNGRYYLAASETAEMRIDMGDVVTFDATGRFSIGTMEVETIKSGAEYILTLTVDKDFLAAESTTYPVSIDPSLSVSDNTHGAGAIEDVSIYSGRPNANGDWTYLHCGYYDDTYQVARTLFRLTGLTEDTTYQTVSASNILSAEFHIREATGSPALPVHLYANTGSASWTESGATWSNAGVTYNTDYYATASPASNSDVSYNITSLLKNWKNNSDISISAAKGFVLVSSNETSLDKAFYSSEFATTNNRPYVMVTYTLNDSEVSVCEGENITLSSAGITGTITWSSENVSVATVSSTGVVTGVKAGKTSITASVNGVLQKTFIVYVRVANGVYYLKNNASNLYLNVHENGVASRTPITQVSKREYMPSCFSMLWKITYLGAGWYTIRPMHKLDMVLDITGGNVDIYKASENDYIDDIYNWGRWSVTYVSGGYVFKQCQSEKVMGPTGLSTAEGATMVGHVPDTIYTAHKWTLEHYTSPVANQMIFYDGKTKTLTHCPTRYVAPSDTYTLTELNISVSFVSETTNQQNISWRHTEEEEATVEQGSGCITAISPGESTTLFADRTYNGVTYSIGYTLHITEIPEGTYFIRSKDTGRYVDIDGQIMQNGTQIHQWDFHGGYSQKWIFKHRGDGTYTIKSANSTTDMYLGVHSNSSEQDANVTLRTGAIESGMTWEIAKTTSGAYKLTPASGKAANRVLAVGWYLANTNGIDILQRGYIDDSNYKDEWSITQLPLSGAEKTYQPELWNNDIIMQNTNCYSYAFNNQIHPNAPYVAFMQPGQSINFPLAPSLISGDLVTELVTQDADKWGFLFEETTRNSVCSDGTYKVALVIAPQIDYHWYRQNADGTWSHKPGAGAVTRLDASKNVIYDPETANRDYYYADYSVFVGYFQVTPLNNLYTVQNITTPSFETEIPNANILGEINIASEISIQDNIIGHTYSEITNLLGEPHAVRTFGLFVVDYLLENGNLLVVEYGLSNGVHVAHNARIEVDTEVLQ